MHGGRQGPGSRALVVVVGLVVAGLLAADSAAAAPKPTATKAVVTKKPPPKKPVPSTKKKAVVPPTPAQDKVTLQKALLTLAELGTGWGLAPEPETIQGVGQLLSCDALPAVASHADVAATYYDRAGRTVVVIASAYKDVATAASALGLWASPATPLCLSDQLRDTLLQTLDGAADIETLDVVPMPPQAVGEQAAYLHTTALLSDGQDDVGFGVDDLIVRQGRFVYLLEATLPDKTDALDAHALARKMLPRLKG